jgi:hypothetical protein
MWLVGCQRVEVEEDNGGLVAQCLVLRYFLCYHHGLTFGRIGERRGVGVVR